MRHCTSQYFTSKLKMNPQGSHTNLELLDIKGRCQLLTLVAVTCRTNARCWNLGNISRFITVRWRSTLIKTKGCRVKFTYEGCTRRGILLTTWPASTRQWLLQFPIYLTTPFLIFLFLLPLITLHILLQDFPPLCFFFRIISSTDFSCFFSSRSCSVALLLSAHMFGTQSRFSTGTSETSEHFCCTNYTLSLCSWYSTGILKVTSRMVKNLQVPFPLTSLKSVVISVTSSVRHSQLRLTQFPLSWRIFHSVTFSSIKAG